MATIRGLSLIIIIKKFFSLRRLSIIMLYVSEISIV